MELQKQKCSLSKHSEIDAVSYCQECKKYFCNKCQNMHSELMDDHKIINLNQKNDVFIDLCKEENHNDKLEYFCKGHNSLCCVACTSKCKNEGYGQHFDCDVYHIKDIKEEKKDKLNKNINKLEEISNGIKESINELKRIFEDINKRKEEKKN